MEQNTAKAILRNVRVSPRKLNLVAAMIRGMKVAKALDVLAFSPKRIALDVRKTLASAIANAETNHGLDIDTLVVTEASVGQSIVLKRFSPRAKGRGVGIKKPFSHLTIKVSEKEV